MDLREKQVSLGISSCLLRRSTWRLAEPACDSDTEVGEVGRLRGWGGREEGRGRGRRRSGEEGKV